MKKQILFCFSSLLMLFMSSCSTEELNSEVTPESPAAKANNRLSAAKFAGDGIYDVLGHGYNVAGEYANATAAGFKVIDIDRFKLEQANRLISENTFSQEYTEEYGENAESYSKMVSTKVNATAGIPLFKKTLSVGFNSAVTTNNKFEGKYIYGSYNLTIKQKRVRFNATTDMLGDYLTPEFVQDLQTKTPQQIVEDYGTHVTLDIYTGAKMDVLFQAETRSQSRDRAARIGVKVGMKDIFDVDVTNDVNTSESSMNYSKKLAYKTRGGDPSKGLVGDLNLDQTNPKINISNWQNSSNASNSVLVDFGSNGLVIIYDLVKDAAKKAQLKAYVDQYLIDNKVYMEFNTIPIYRYYNGVDHYYTKTPGSYNGYSYEGTEFNAFLYKAPNTIPIYRYWNGRDHYYTRTPGYYQGYVDEGIEFNAFATQQPNTVPIYRYWNGKDHYYSRSSVRPSGYVYEGIEFYAY
ncbi:MAC/Perforin domain-containing protein [Chryseobacterium sp. CBTAP 102]|uniref:MAC/perforin domain-containing protein n=1 Tax=Chryseobacterium sp. CBTAP 102 TaxID=2135644 RepID=UPI000D76A2B9|nr:MAC/perforin domain-containing protein [Chryseobacterium sp. CBTAP 102]PXW10404.1 MAC/Perforin domain-containing protein [Chryseobacterium sp. CBTAP 102]